MATVQCSHSIDSLGNARRRGKNNRPWWRRQCKRKTSHPSGKCWQHR